MPFWCYWLHSESPSSGCMLCLLTKFFDYNLCIFFLINLPFIFTIWVIHRKFSCLEEDSSEKKNPEMWWHPIVIIYMLSLKKIILMSFKRFFLVSSKAASYIFYSREDRFCWIAVILPACFFSLMQNMLDFLCQSYLKLPWMTGYHWWLSFSRLWYTIQGFVWEYCNSVLCREQYS